MIIKLKDLSKERVGEICIEIRLHEVIDKYTANLLSDYSGYQLPLQTFSKKCFSFKLQKKDAASQVNHIS